MKSYYRIMLGKGSAYAEECLKGGFIGSGWLENIDLSGKLLENWRDFNKEFIPIYLNQYPGKSKIAAGLACGMLHTICKGISLGDIILSPDGKGKYLVGEVAGDYEYCAELILPHRRKINWLSGSIARGEMSEALRNSCGSIGMVSDISRYGNEVEDLISGNSSGSIISTDQSIEDPTIFVLEKHLEDFLVHNWSHTELGKNYDIYQEEGDIVGQQYPSDTGPIDILAISKDKKEILVVELKKGRASDMVVGQIQRYMGYVVGELAEEGQLVKGAIIAFEDDLKIRRALSVANNIEFYTYNISFKLNKI